MSILSKSQGIGMAAVLLAMGMVLSRLMGIVREKFISWQFGAGSEADIYFAAFVVPDIINYLLAGGFMAITLIPMMSRIFAADEADGWRFFSCVLTWMAIAAVLCTGAALYFVEPLSSLAAPGLAPERAARLQFFMHLTLPTQFFFLTGSCVMAMLYLRRQFVVPSLTPLIYNFSIISMGVLLPELGLVHGMTGYCIGVLAGAAIGALILPLVVVHQGGGLHYRPCFWHPQIKRFLLLALPLMLGQTIAALDEQFLRVCGSLTGEGAVSLLSYARRISSVPTALIGQVAGLASYPFLVALLTRGDREGFLRVLSISLRTGLCLVVPVVLFLIVLAPSTFTVLFYGGRMSDAEIARAVPLLRILLCASPVWVLLEFVVRAYYAQTDTITPSLWGTVVTVIFLPVYYFLAVPLGVDGVAVCSVVSIMAFTGILVWLWLRRQEDCIFRGLGLDLAKSVFCAAPGLVLAWCVDGWITRTMTTWSPIFTALIALCAAGLCFCIVFVPLAMHLLPDVYDRILGRLKNRLSRRAS